MERRKFIQLLPFGGVLLFKLSNVLSAALPKFLTPQNSENQSSHLRIITSRGESAQIPLWWNYQTAYLSALQLARALQFHTYVNDAKRKIVLYLPQNQVVITANNAFVIIDKDVFQIPVPAVWHNEEIFIPAKYCLDLLSRRTTLIFEYDSDRQVVRVSQQDVNITGLSIAEKENGTLIRVRTTKNFREGEITADMRYGWLHVDFYGGKADSTLISHTRPAGLVRRIKTFQFSELASLAFFLREEPLSREIIYRPEKNEVLIVLRTKEGISDRELAEAEDDPDQEISEDLKKQLEEERRRWLIDTVVIDPGHGGKDPGTVGVGNLYEKNVVLPIALKLGKIIEKELPDVKVIYTRSTDRFVPLRRRTQIANENNGKVFISIHANSSKKKRVSGFETYILGPEKGEQARDVVLKENSVINFEDSSTRQEYEGINQILATMAQNAFSRQSEHLAGLIQQEIHKQFRGLKLPNRGVKQGPFWVMVGATMPNILVETGYISNPFDAKILRTSAYQTKMARGIFDGLVRFKRDYENAI